MSETPESAMFRPPINRAMRVLDRSFFQKSIPISAARIRDNKQISKYRTELGHDLLKLDRMHSIRSVRDSEGQESKALLLRPEVRQDGNSTFSVFAFLLVFPLKKKRGDREGVKRGGLRFCLSDASTWSPKLSALVKASQVSLLPYDLKLDYDYWNYRMYVEESHCVLETEVAHSYHQMT